MAGDGRDSTGRDESPAERSDRNGDELLQEVRVSQTGAQVLTAFLVSLPFQQRFTALRPWLRADYLATTSAAVVATVLLVAPVAVHRALFRHHDKAALVTAGDRLVRAGIAMLGVSVTGAVTLILGVVSGTTAGVAAAVLAAVAIVGLWAALPLALRARLARERR